MSNFSEVNNQRQQIASKDNVSGKEGNDLIVGNPDCRFSNVIFAFLNDESTEVSAKFPHVASSLGVNDLEVETLRQALTLERLSVMDVYGKIIMDWKTSQGSGATLQKLIEVLETHKLQKTANALRTKFGLP